MDISSKIRFLTMVPVTLNAPGLPPNYKVARISACISRTYKINYLRRVFYFYFALLRAMEVRSLITRELWWRDFFSVLKHVSSPKAKFLVLSALEVVSLSLEI